MRSLLTKGIGVIVIVALLAFATVSLLGTDLSPHGVPGPAHAAQLRAPGATHTIVVDHGRARFERLRVHRVIALAAPVERWAVENVSGTPLSIIESPSTPQGAASLSSISRAPPVVGSRS